MLMQITMNHMIIMNENLLMDFLGDKYPFYIHKIIHHVLISLKFPKQFSSVKAKILTYIFKVPFGPRLVFMTS